MTFFEKIQEKVLCTKCDLLRQKPVFGPIEQFSSDILFDRTNLALSDTDSVFSTKFERKEGSNFIEMELRCRYWESRLSVKCPYICSLLNFKKRIN